MSYYTTFQLVWEDPSEDFSFAAALDVLIEQREDLPKEPIRIDGVVITPSGDKYTITPEKAETIELKRQGLRLLGKVLTERFGHTEEEARERKNFTALLMENESARWREYPTDMKRLSRAFPEMTFILYRDGEHSDDFTKEFFRDGVHKSVKARIVYDDPDF